MEPWRVAGKEVDVAARSYLSSNISTQYCKHGKSVSLQYSWTKEPVGRWYPNTQKKIDILLRTKQGNDCLTKKASLFTSYQSLHCTMDYFTLKFFLKRKNTSCLHHSCGENRECKSLALWWLPLKCWIWKDLIFPVLVSYCMCAKSKHTCNKSKSFSSIPSSSLRTISLSSSGVHGLKCSQSF